MARRTTNNTTAKATDTVVLEKPKHANDDLIPCKSITNGGLYVTGEKTKMLYSFADYGDEVEIEYQDLIYMIRSRDKAVYEPRLFIMDKAIVDEYPELSKVYEALYSVKDLKEVLKLPTAQMQKTIDSLPKGSVETLKGLVSTMIDNHQLDSVSKIKALDAILGTNHLLLLAQS